jgi:hypothetical protein
MAMLCFVRLSSCAGPGLRFRALLLVGLLGLGACRAPMHAKSAATGGVVGGDGPAATGGTSATGGASGMGGALGSGGAPDAKDSSEAPSCEELAMTAEIQFQAYLSSTSALACQVDSDCTSLHLQSLNCFAACGQIIGQADSGAVTTAAAGACAQYVAASCPEIRLACPASKLICSDGLCVSSWPWATDPVPDASSSPSDSGADSPACSMPSVGAACTPDQTPCATCCTDHWSCVNGNWQDQFLGCLPTGFTCGDQSCSEAAQYCALMPGIPGGELPLPPTYACQTLPSPCNGRRCPACDCLKEAGISFSTCASGPSGAIYVTY